MRFCSECGNPLTEGDLFCSECGTRVNPLPENDSIQDESLSNQENIGDQSVQPQPQHDENNIDTSPQSNQGDSQEQSFQPNPEDNENQSFYPNQSGNVNQPFTQQPSFPQNYEQQTQGDGPQSSVHQPNYQQYGYPPGQGPVQGGGGFGPPPAQVPPKKPRKPLSKGAKISIISSAALIVLLVVAHFVLNHIFSPDRLIDNFEEALKDKDVDALVEMLSADHKDVKIDKKAVEAYLGYFEDNKDDEKEVIRSLERQADGRSSSVHMAKLEQDGKFLYFDKYKIVVPTGKINVMTNVEGAKILVNGEEVGVSDSDFYEKTFGPFITGKHKVEAVLETDYLELSVDEEVTIYDDGEYFVDLYIEAEEIYFYVPNIGSDVKIKLLINGKDVGIDLNEEDSFGPVLTDGSMTYAFEAELPWGTVRTEDKPIDSSYIDVVLVDEKLKDSVMDVAHRYQLEWIQAVTSDNPDAITLGIEDSKDAAQLMIDALKSSNIAVSFQYLSTSFDLNSFELYYNEFSKEWTIEFSARSTYLYNEFAVDEEPPELQEVEEDFTYQLIYDEEQEKWVVDYLMETWFYNDEETEEITVESPETLTSTWANLSADASESNEGSEESADEESDE